MEEIMKAWSLTGTLTVLVKAAIRTYCEAQEAKYGSRNIMSLKRYDNGFTAQWISDWEPVLLRDENRWVTAGTLEAQKGQDVYYWNGTAASLIRLTIQ